jgi:ribulose-phosphate 3-epimerase
MSVNPGFSGQTFIPSVLEKIQEARELIKIKRKKIRLAVDGGINLNNISDIAKAGADTFVSGSTIFGAKNYKEIIDKFRERLNAV